MKSVIIYVPIYGCITMQCTYRVTDHGLQESKVMNNRHAPCSPVTQHEELTQQDINDLLHVLKLSDIKNFEEWNI